MSKTDKIKHSVKLYPFYEAASGDLLFFSVVQTLFLTQVKGFSAEQIATIILIADIVDLALEYPTYRMIRRLGNSRSCVIGGIMPLIGITLITLGLSLPVITIGMIFFISAGNFQSMAQAAAKNNLMLLGESPEYVKLFSKSNTIYSAISIVSAAVIPILFSFNRYIPSVLCFVTCALVAAASFFIVDYSEHGGSLPPPKEQKKPPVKIGRGLWLILAVFCLFFCAGAVFTNNTEVFLSNKLGEMFHEQETIFIYGAIIWAARLLRLCSSILLPKILDKLKERILVIASAGMLISFLVVGVSGLMFRSTIHSIVLAGAAYVVLKGIFWDPLRTFLRMKAVDTNSKKRQQSMLVYLNSGQSVVSIIMDLIVVGILKIFSLEYVFLAFAGISIVTVICAWMLRRELKRRIELLHLETVLNEAEIDRISRILYEKLTESGMASKEALSYRLLAEEKLLESMANGKRENKVCLSLFSALDSCRVSLIVDKEERELFTLPGDEDSITQMIFRNIIKNL